MSLCREHQSFRGLRAQVISERQGALAARGFRRSLVIDFSLAFFSRRSTGQWCRPAGWKLGAKERSASSESQESIELAARRRPQAICGRLNGSTGHFRSVLALQLLFLRALFLSSFSSAFSWRCSGALCLWLGPQIESSAAERAKAVKAAENIHALHSFRSFCELSLTFKLAFYDTQAEAAAAAAAAAAANPLKRPTQCRKFSASKSPPKGILLSG